MLWVLCIEIEEPVTNPSDIGWKDSKYIWKVLLNETGNTDEPPKAWVQRQVALVDKDCDHHVNQVSLFKVADEIDCSDILADLRGKQTAYERQKDELEFERLRLKLGR